MTSAAETGRRIANGEARKLFSKFSSCSFLSRYASSVSIGGPGSNAFEDQRVAAALGPDPAVPLLGWTHMREVQTVPEEQKRLVLLRCPHAVRRRCRSL